MVLFAVEGAQFCAKSGGTASPRPDMGCGVFVFYSGFVSRNRSFARG